MPLDGYRVKSRMESPGKESQKEEKFRIGPVASEETLTPWGPSNRQLDNDLVLSKENTLERCNQLHLGGF